MNKQENIFFPKTEQKFLIFFSILVISLFSSMKNFCFRLFWGEFFPSLFYAIRFRI